MEKIITSNEVQKRGANDLFNKYYKLFLIIPIILLLSSIAYIGYFYSQNNDFLHRDLSLTGGTTITLFSNVSLSDLEKEFSGKISNLELKTVSETNSKQTQVVILTSQKPEEVIPLIESYLGYTLTSDNSSVEFTGSSLSESFYKQLGITVLIAFFWMAAVVFVIFAKKWRLKLLAIVLNLLFGIFLGKMFFSFEIILSLIILLIFVVAIVFIYMKYSMPSFAVMFCAFADIIMTLAVVDLIGMKIAGAGIVAFLMLIGYSVDTDILLTTRILTRKENSINKEIFGAFKTGMTMTLTAISALAVALIFVRPFGTVLNQMFDIILIGLFFDIINTWLTNTALLKWFIESKEKHNEEVRL